MKCNPGYLCFDCVTLPEFDKPHPCLLHHMIAYLSGFILHLGALLAFQFLASFTLEDYGTPPPVLLSFRHEYLFTLTVIRRCIDT
jgi:hypothetical protein